MTNGGLSDEMNEQSALFLMSLFEEHGITAVSEDGWIVLVDYGLRAACAVFPQPEQKSARVLRLDVVVETALGRPLVESFAGIGASWEEALADAWENFISNSFHVILSAFFTGVDDDQVTREVWEIDGTERTVIFGNLGIRGGKETAAGLSFDWFAAFEQAIRATSLPEGSHWVRLYYAHRNHKTVSCDVLLDNEDWPDVGAEMAEFPWPSQEGFYSVRLFLIILD